MKRLESLDALRGFDMFFISGGAALLVALAALFPDNGVWQTIEEHMHHVDWDGLRHHDTIFPLFLFIAGISWPMSLAAQRERGASCSSIYLKILRRGVTLFLLGMIYGGLLNMQWDTQRICSVLGRIGLAWMFGALIYTSVSDWRRILGVVVTLLVGYWLVNVLLVAPDVAPGTDPLSREGNIGCYLDRVILGAHCYRPGLYDPEGLFSTIPAIGTALLGMLTGRFVLAEDPRLTPQRKALWLALAGVACAVIGWGWGLFYPINKALWSSSFVMAVAGYSLLMFALFYYIIDVRGWRRWDFFFVVIGMNSITIYLTQRMGLYDDVYHFLSDGTVSLFPESLQPVAAELAYIAVWWCFLWLLYRHKIFLKV